MGAKDTVSLHFQYKFAGLIQPERKSSRYFFSSCGNSLGVFSQSGNKGMIIPHAGFSQWLFLIIESKHPAAIDLLLETLYRKFGKIKRARSHN